MAKQSYQNANTTVQSTFRQWLEQHNMIVNDMSQVVVTTSVDAPNTSNGGVTTGNMKIVGEIISDDFTSNTITSNDVENSGNINTDTINVSSGVTANTVETTALTSGSVENSGNINTTTINVSNTIVANSATIESLSTGSIENIGNISSNTASVASLTTGSIENIGNISSNTLNVIEISTNNIVANNDVVIHGNLNVEGVTSLASNNVFSLNTSISNVMTVNENLYSNGNTTLGTNSNNTILINGTISGDIIPSANSVFSIGSAVRRFSSIFVDTLNGMLDWSFVANKPSPKITLNMTGDVTGTSNTTLEELQSNTLSLSLSIANNALGIFSSVSDGNTAVQSSNKNDQLKIVGSSGVSVIANTVSKTLNVASTIPLANSSVSGLLSSSYFSYLSDLDSTTVWTAANDGPSSGLNADLLDGLHSSSFIRNDQSSTITGQISVNIATENMRFGYGSAAGSDPYISFYNGTTRLGYLQAYDTGQMRIYNDIANVALDISADGNTLSFNGGQVTYSGVAQTIAGSKTFTSTVTAPTFNATSTSGGGFQGIDTDSAAVPSFTWSVDQNTGMYRVGENAIGFSCGSVNRGSITSNGFEGAGGKLTGLNASNITTGTLNNARLNLAWSTIDSAMVGMTVGSVGSLAFCTYGGSTDIDTGDTTSGSNLTYANANGVTPSAGGPAGTWRALGNTTQTSNATRTTLFLRIA